MVDIEKKSRPILGILIDEVHHEKRLINKLNKSEFKYYLEACNDIGALAYIFTLNGIDIANSRVRGYIPSMDIYNKIIIKERWLPIPDLILNRALVPAASSKYKKLSALLNTFPNIEIVNRISRVNKWVMHKILMNNTLINKYLPKTVLFSGINSLVNMLREFPCVYLKPIGRSLGLGIIRILRENENKYKAEYRLKKVNHSISGSLDDILVKLRPIMGKWTYIVQQGIPLASYKGSIFDIRVCMQKDETGDWSAPRWMIRSAKAENVVTNIAAGGRGLQVEYVISKLFEEKSSLIIEEIKNAGLQISKIIEKSFTGIADIGIDLGITKDGKLYFIEANLRQSRLSSVNKGEYPKWRNTFRKPIYYLNYLYELKQNSRKL